MASMDNRGPLSDVCQRKYRRWSAFIIKVAVTHCVTFLDFVLFVVFPYLTYMGNKKERGFPFLREQARVTRGIRVV